MRENRKAFKRMTKSVSAIMLVIALCASPVFAGVLSTSHNSVNISVNGAMTAVKGESFALADGSTVPFSILYSGTTYLPLRKVCELVGKDIEWDAESRTAHIIPPESALPAPVASQKAPVAGSTVNIDASLNSIQIAVNNQLFAEIGDSFALADGSTVPFSILYKGTTYLPLRKVCDLVGKDVAWDGNTKTVSITDREAVPMYSRTSVPDFGAISGLEPVDDGEQSVAEQNTIMYIYDLTGYTGDLSALVDKYVAALFENEYYFVMTMQSQIVGVDVYVDAYAMEGSSAVVSLAYGTADDGSMIMAVSYIE